MRKIAYFIMLATLAPALSVATSGVVHAKDPAKQTRYSTKTKLGVLMNNPKTLAILQKHIPEAMADPEIGKGRNYSLRFIGGFDKKIKAALPAIERDLAAVQ